MFEKVNPGHPDKVADRIAGAIVDLAYRMEDNPKIAVEVLIGHGKCHIIAETSVADIRKEDIDAIVNRIAGDGLTVIFDHVAQDIQLAENQNGKMRCGDNGIFCGMPITDEQDKLSHMVRDLYKKFPTDGKYIIAKNRYGSFNVIACQSCVSESDLSEEIYKHGNIDYPAIINPLGEWTGGTDVDTGATNRKLGSDMGDAVTGGGLHGKDLSKADVSVNIYAHVRAQITGKPVRLYCAIGDEYIDGLPFSAIVETAKDYINSLGGFEKLAEWGLI